MSSSTICACTVTSSALVGSSARRISGSSAMAMAMATRWFMPPDSCAGQLSRMRSGSGNSRFRRIADAEVDNNGSEEEARISLAAAMAALKEKGLLS